MRIWIGLALGASCAVVIACGGGKMKSATPTAAGAEPPPRLTPRAELDALDAQIDADLATLQLARPAPALEACIQPPCAATPFGLPAKHTDDAQCRPGPSEACGSSCVLSDSICHNAGRICELATDLGGRDAYANEKCASGKASCTAARAKCCGCQL